MLFWKNVLKMYYLSYMTFIFAAVKPIIQTRAYKKCYGPFGQKYYENYVKMLNSKNITTQNNAILNTPSNENLQKQEVSARSYSRSRSDPEYYDMFGNPVHISSSSNKKSENFEVIKNFDFSFKK